MGKGNRAPYQPNRNQKIIGHTSFARGTAKAIRRDAFDPTQVGDDVALKLEYKGRDMLLPLTSFTEEELRCLKTVIDLALEASAPVAVARDKRAEQDYADGNPPRERLHRAIPRLVVEPRYVHQDLDGVPERPDAVPGGAREGDDGGPGEG